MLLFVFSSLSFSAPKPARNVYGVFSESSSGAVIDAPASNMNAVTVDYWEWNNFSLDTVSDGGAIEGKEYWKIENGAGNYGAIGLGLKNALDMGKNGSKKEYTCIKFFVKSSYSKMANFKVGIVANGKTYSKKIGELGGFSADGNWHELSFPLNDYLNDLSNVTNLFFFQLGGTGETVNYHEGDTIFFDNIRWVRDEEGGEYSVTVKAVSNNDTVVNASSITFSSSLFRQSWAIAEQYLEIEYDKDSPNWKVMLYVDNGSADRNGMYAVKNGQQYGEVLPMCWRASEKILSDSSESTTKIGEDFDGKNYYLYDKGNGDKDFRCWLYMQDLVALETDKDKDYSTVMGYSAGGYHAYSGEYGKFSNSGYYSGSKVSLYFGANCKEAVGGLEYKGKVCVVLVHE